MLVILQKWLKELSNGETIEDDERKEKPRVFESMIYINLLKSEKREKPLGILGCLSSKSKQYIIGAIAGLGLLAGSTAQQLVNYENILYHIKQQRAQLITDLANNYQEQNKDITDEKNLFSLAYQATQKDFSLAQKDNVYFSLEGFKLTPIEDLYKKNQNNDNKRPAVLDTIDAKIGEYVLVVNKETQTAQLYKLDFVAVNETLISTGKNLGDKEKEGDSKTPEGVFKVASVENSSNWKYEGELAYGPHFLRLDYSLNSVSSIGVHGTSIDEDEKLGSPASHGCVRMNNDIISWYVRDGYLKPGTKVAIVENNNDVPSLAYTTFTSELTKLSADAVNYSDDLEDLVNSSIKKVAKSENKTENKSESKADNSKEITKKKQGE